MTMEEIRQKRDKLNKEMEDLQKQEDQLKNEERKIEIKRRNRLVQAMKDHKDFVLMLFPEHERTSCSDDNVVNGFYMDDTIGCRCTRCGILEILNDEMPSDLYIDFDIFFGEL